MINGKLVIQGTCIDDYGPSLCIVEHSTDQENYSLVAELPPWQMDFSPSEGFTIMIDLGDDIAIGNIRIKVFVAEARSIPYESTEDIENQYDMSPETYIQAFECITNVVSETSNDNNNNGAIDISNSIEIDIPNIPNQEDTARDEVVSNTEVLVVTDIKIVREYEEIVDLNKDGYVLQNISLNESGVDREINYLWKFYILVKYGPIDQGGLEQIDFIRCSKDIENPPNLDGFIVFSEIDLAVDVPDCQVSIEIFNILKSYTYITNLLFFSIYFLGFHLFCC